MPKPNNFDAVRNCGPADVRLAIVGNRGGTNIGDSLNHAAIAAGHSVTFFDAYKARAPRIINSFSWRFLDRRPGRLHQFSKSVRTWCLQNRPSVLITTGSAPLVAADLEQIRRGGALCMNYATDDPWSPVLRSTWHLQALPTYDIVFTPRKSNVDDLRRLGCRDVSYMPFGYDERHFRSLDPPQVTSAGSEVLFVGGADPDRVAFMSEFISRCPSISLVGDCWDRYAATRPYAIGHKPPETLRALTASAKVNLCLVRRSNRDGHVMRSFEIGAVGGCMLAEDTDEHRDIFGPDGETVLYFRNAIEASERALWLIARSSERERLSSALHAKISMGKNTYRDRLSAMLATVGPILERSDLVETAIPTGAMSRIIS